MTLMQQAKLNLLMSAGAGTGTGGGGAIVFQTAAAGVSGTTLNTQTERMRITNTGNVGIKATGANLLSVNNLTTADSTAQLAVSTGGTTNKGLVIQGVAGQTAEYLQVQDSSGVNVFRILNNGDVDMNYSTLYTGGLSNPSTFVNSNIELADSGTRIRTGVAANVALKLQNTNASPTGDLLQLHNTGGSVLTGFNSYGHLYFNNNDGTTPSINLASSPGGVEINSTGENYFNIFSENSIGFRIDTNNNSTSEYNFANGANNTIATLDESAVFTLGNASLTGKLAVNDGNGQTTTLQAGDSTSNLSFTLPTTVGSASQCLMNSGTAGTLTFGNCGAGVTLQTAYDNSGIPATIATSSTRSYTQYSTHCRY
jgi:hypothetical protein